MREPDSVSVSAESLKVEEILRRASEGRLRVPPFQRPLKWRQENIVKLFDSIARGYPIGGLLLWETGAGPANLSFGPVGIEGGARSNALQIVDGQQRVTALVGALLRDDERPIGDKFAVWVDLRTGVFQVPKRHPDDPRVIPVNRLRDNVALFRWSKDNEKHGVAEGDVTRAAEIMQRLLNYSLPAYVISGADEAALKEIFTRSNTTGIGMKESEVFEALFGDEEEQKPLAALAASIRDATGFGEVKPDWLLRCVSAVGGSAEKFKIDASDRTVDERLAQTRVGFTSAVRFLQEHAEIPHAAVLPYRFPLIVLTRFFHLHPSPANRTLDLLARWVWRGAISQTHAGSSNAAVSAHLNDLSPQDEAGSVTRLLSRVPDRLEVPGPMGVWHGRGATTRVYAGLMLAHRQQDLPGGSDEITAALDRGTIGEVFRPIGGVEGEEIATRCFRPDPGEAVVAVDLDEEALSMHLIPPEAIDRLLRGDQEGFTRERAKRMKRALRERVDRLAGKRENDRPAIAHLVAGAGVG